MWSMAAIDTRTQPCDAGYGGTAVYPWSAIPLYVKYFGRYSSPRWDTRQSSIWRKISKRPVGVSAKYVVPS